MTYTPEMYGLRRGKPGPGNDYYQASNKPPGALAAQCAHERSAADVQEWREEEFGARVDDIKRLKKRNLAKKNGSVMEKLLRRIGLGFLVDGEDMSAHDQALHSMPNYEHLDDKQRARLRETTPYPFHTKESAQAFEDDKARRQRIRDEEQDARDIAKAFEYFDDAVSLTQYHYYLVGKKLVRRPKFSGGFESLYERQTRMLYDAFEEFKRIVLPLHDQLIAMKESGVDTASDEYRRLRTKLVKAFHAMNGPEQLAAMDEGTEAVRRKEKEHYIKSTVERVNMDQYPEYIIHDTLPKDDQIAMFKDIIHRYNRGEQLPDHELKFYALALQSQEDELKKVRKDIANKSTNIVWMKTRVRSFSISPRQSPHKTPDLPPGDKPPRKVPEMPICGPRYILCFELEPFTLSDYDEMCRKTYVEGQLADVLRRGEKYMFELSKPKPRRKNWRHLLRKETASDTDSDECSFYPSIPWYEMMQLIREKRAVDNSKPLPLVSPAKNDVAEVVDNDFDLGEIEEISKDGFKTGPLAMSRTSEFVDDDFNFILEEEEAIAEGPRKAGSSAMAYAPQFTDDDFIFIFEKEEEEEFAGGDTKTDSPAMDNTTDTIKDSDDDFSFDQDKTSEIDVESISRIMNAVSETTSLNQEMAETFKGDFLADYYAMRHVTEAAENSDDEFSFDQDKSSEMDFNFIFPMMDQVPETLETTSLYEAMSSD
ncbi:hypothetical protein D6C84_07304 [Aureobasidium pullulans]|uniref:Uncharacterized protein n=1 Tax=Aureobasidium pullulans TaxID=5580 RepID=A0A4S9XLI3_AURPU|nr:hypothetical protein D6C84_07304 [Aureobasidium pullulans]